MKLKHAHLLCAIVGVPGIAMPAFAANPAPATTGNELEEVVITAERRTTDVQRTAASVSVRTGEELALQGRYTTQDILEDIPGLVAGSGAAVSNVGAADVQGNSITIRGITPRGSAGGGASAISATPGAAVYVDGVIEGVGSNYDIDRVEVLRGPQGTLYGRSATTGVVAFHTRNPSLNGFAGNASAEFGDYSLQHYTAAANIPLTETLAARVSGDYRDQGDAYYGQATRGKGERTSGRAKVLWKPNDALSLLVGFAYEDREDFSGGTTSVAAVPSFVLTTTTSPVFSGFKHQRQYWAEGNWDVGPVTVTYLPAFRGWQQEDYQFGTANFRSSGAGRWAVIKTPKDDFTTHELRVASRDSTVQWQAGIFYYHNVLSNTNHNYLVNNSTGTEISFLADSRDDKDTKSLGYFAETTFPLGDTLRITLGARYDDTKVVVSEFIRNNPYGACGSVAQATVQLPPGATCIGPGQASVPIPDGTFIPGITVNFHNFNYKARLEYDLTPKNMLYGTISTGFRPGDAGINGMTRAVNILDAEKLTSIEVGSKNRFLDDSLQLNVGVFHYTYRGFQTSYRPDTPAFDPASTGNNLPITVPAHNIGGELELLYRLTARDRIGLNGNYVESRWFDKPEAFAAAQPETKRAMTPYTFTANYQHEFTLPGGSTLSTRIDGRYEAAHLASDLHVDWLRIGWDSYVYLGARTIGNLSAVWASNGGRYSVSAYVRNFTDRQYTSYGLIGDTTSVSVNVSDPRTYGAQISARF